MMLIFKLCTLWEKQPTNAKNIGVAGHHPIPPDLREQVGIGRKTTDGREVALREDGNFLRQERRPVDDLRRGRARHEERRGRGKRSQC